MYLVIGSGKNRRVFEIPCAYLVKTAKDPESVVLLRDNLCTLLGIPGYEKGAA